MSDNPTYVYDTRTQMQRPIVIVYDDKNLKRVLHSIFEHDELSYLICTKSKMHSYERDPYRVYRNAPSKEEKKSTNINNIIYDMKKVSEIAKREKEKNLMLRKLNDNLVEENNRLNKLLKEKNESKKV